MVRLTYVEDSDYFFEASEVLRNRLTTPLVCIAVLACAGGSVLKSYLEHNPRWWIVLAAWTPVFSIVWLFMLSRHGRRALVTWGLRGIIKEPSNEVMWEFGEGSIVRIEQKVRSHFEWKAFESLEEQPNGWMLRVDAASCFWFPKRLFASDQEMKCFVTLFQNHGVSLRTL
jgi:hypothetical protein